jgi:hypothetical protein
MAGVALYTIHPWPARVKTQKKRLYAARYGYAVAIAYPHGLPAIRIASI